LPTDNERFFTGGGPDFYQYVSAITAVKNRRRGRRPYGFVRDPEQTGAGVVYTAFHEGIDIRCLHRDECGDARD